MSAELDQRVRLAAVAGFAALIVGTLAVAPVAGCTVTRLELLGTPADMAAADVVFTGTVVQRDEPLSFGLETAFDPIGWTFVVDSVEKGDWADRIRVESAGDPGSCGFEFRLGERYRVFADRSGWFSLSTGLGQVASLEPLANPPPTEPGAVNFLSWQALGAVLGAAVVGSAAWHRGFSSKHRR